MRIWRSIRGMVAGVGAFVVCPCHLPLTLPLLVAATAGTAFGAWLESNRGLFVTAVVISFLVMAALAYRWLGARAPAGAVPVAEPGDGDRRRKRMRPTPASEQLEA